MDEDEKALYRAIYRLRRNKGICTISGCKIITNGKSRCPKHTNHYREIGIKLRKNGRIR